MTHHLVVDDFPVFFRAGNNGHDPFPWQGDLVASIAEALASPEHEGPYWPTLVDLPTGSGKSSLVDIAVFLLALEAHPARPLFERRLPRRIVFVVDRRVAVDQAHRHARDLSRLLRDDGADAVVRQVAERLRSYSSNPVGHAHPTALLPTTVLRGGIIRDELWARRPDVPAIITSTVDQVGSRLLFHGYGLSSSAQPIHTGLLGTDALFLLDEVHLARPFADTLTTLAERYQPQGAGYSLPARWEITQLSATPETKDDAGDEPKPSESGNRTFRLGDNDRDAEKAPVLVQRLAASKEASFKTVATRSKDPQRANRTFAAAAADELQQMLELPFRHTVAVIVNRVDQARTTYEEIRNRLGENVDVDLLTGRMRSPERDRLVNTLASALHTGRSREESGKKRVMVATQCIEAGADFDFDGLITECASIDALLQRFGRLDRGGWLTKNGTPPVAVVLARSTDIAPGAVDPVYGEALRRTWEALEPLSPVNFGPSDFPEDLRRDPTLRPIAQSSPALLDTHLDAWVQTRPAPTPDPDPSLWLHGLGRESRDVNVVWRSDLDAALLTPPGDGGRGDDHQRHEEWIAGIRSIVTAIPPATAEAISLPIIAVRQWLLGEPSKGMADIEGPVEMESDDQTGDRRTPRRDGPPPVVLWNGDRSEVLIPSRASFDRIAPGTTILVPSEFGGIGDHDSWDPTATSAVSDIAELSQLRLRRRPVLRILPGVLPVGVELPEADDPETSDQDRVGAWIAAQIQALDDHAWNSGPSSDVARRATIKALAGPGSVLKAGARVEAIDVHGVNRGFVVTGPRLAEDEFQNLNLDHDDDHDPGGRDDVEAGTDTDTTDPDLSSFTAVAASLTTHLRGVREWARCLATNCGLPPELIADLALAGEFHDLGKADPRFQSILRAGGVPQELRGEILAKSAIPPNDFKARRSAERLSRYPAGTRHEMMSLALIDDVEPFRRRAHDWDLVRHLVASHHGWCRPFPPATLDNEPVEVTVVHDDIDLKAKSNHNLARLDQGVPERFWILVRRYGWFRLAWLEAILRLADQNRSEAEQRGHAS